LLSLYRGDLLPSDRDEPWALRPRLRLRAQFIRCLGSLGVRLEAIGHWQLALDCYRRGLEVDDVAEEFYQGVMRCYARLAQPAQGMAAFERLRQTLATALGVVPSSVSEALAIKLREQFRVPSVNS
jgi:DNA-binding SARP family transcriptional activator